MNDIFLNDLETEIPSWEQDLVSTESTHHVDMDNLFAVHDNEISTLIHAMNNKITL